MKLTSEDLNEMEQILNSPAGKRPRRKRSITTTSPLDARARRAMGTLARKLASGPPEERRKWIGNNVLEQPTSTIAGLVDSLIVALLRATDPSARDRFIDTLSEFGSHAVSAVAITLVKAKHGRQQGILAKVCEKMAPNLSARERGELGLHLIDVTSRVIDVEAHEAIAHAIVAIRIAGVPHAGQNASP